MFSKERLCTLVLIMDLSKVVALKTPNKTRKLEGYERNTMEKDLFFQINMMKKRLSFLTLYFRPKLNSIIYLTHTSGFAFEFDGNNKVR